ncbi:MAG: hypothetical protein V1702_05990 [Candidatus Woesearchaeota archaeon]
MKTVLFFGNPLVEKDSLLHRIMPALRSELPDVEFVEAEGSELPAAKELNILDVADGIREVVLIDDVEKLRTERIFSMHDFDLAQNLKMMKRFKMVDKVNIIAVPSGMGEKTAVEGIKKVLWRGSEFK